MVKRTVAAIAAFAALSVFASAHTQRSSDDADAKEIAAYRLTMPALQKMIAAAHAMRDSAMKDPKFREAAAAQRELDALQQKENRTPSEDKRIEALEQQTEAFEKSMGGDDDNHDDSLRGMEHEIATIPYMRDALQTAGLTPREFATFEMCAMQAGMVAGLEKSGQKLTSLPADIQPANVQFMKDHEKDFEALKAAMEGVGK
jgi:hypothetical protein